MSLMCDYRRTLYLYGIDNLLRTLKAEEQAENYEECIKIKEAIEHHNKLVSDDLPTNQ